MNVGDHRASIKIEFEMHGIKRQCDMYINYYACDSIDRRVLEFFENAVEDAMDAYNKKMRENNINKIDKEMELHDLEEFERLKMKFKE